MAKCECGKPLHPFVEFDVRRIDEWGDCYDFDGYDTIEEARKCAEAAMTNADPELRAVLIERHVGRGCDDCGIDDSDTYETVQKFGDLDAIAKFREEA